jgi:serine/threonine-protein kinase ATR
MPPSNGVQSVNGFRPPPSSILAARVVNGDDSSDFNQASFNQLLEESLGTDEDGQPNLGSDISINHKLICIVVKAGIDPFIQDTKDNPFQSTAAAAKVNSQFSCCLDVIRTAIQRSPDVSFVKSVPEELIYGGKQRPLYAWLIPKLVPVLSPTSAEVIRDGILKVLDVILTIEGDDLKGSQGNAVFEFALGCVSGDLFSFSLIVLS